jgi:hypothetical protein
VPADDVDQGAHLMQILGGGVTFPLVLSDSHLQLVQGLHQLHEQVNTVAESVIGGPRCCQWQSSG